MRIATVLIEGPNGPISINRTDYDPEQHTLYGGDVLQTEGGETVPAVPQHPVNSDGLRTDGPTIAEFIAAGYSAANYPPQGCASRSTPEEIAAALPPVAPPAPPAPVPPPPPSNPPADDAKPMVAQIGERFFIVNRSGDKLSGKGISPTGYATNEKAWEAASALA